MARNSNVNKEEKALRRSKGEGCISKKPRKDGLYQGYFIVGRDEETGKLIKKFAYGKTKEEVRKKLDEIKLQAKQGAFEIKDKGTLDECFKKWLEFRTKLEPTTKKTYESYYRNSFQSVLGAIKLEEIKKD
jgi:integrase